MKKLLIILLIIALMPIIVFADESENPVNIENTSTTSSTINEISKSPDTGVEDYFFILGIVSIVIAGTLYIINKKNVFTEI